MTNKSLQPASFLECYSQYGSAGKTGHKLCRIVMPNPSLLLNAQTIAKVDIIRQ